MQSQRNHGITTQLKRKDNRTRNRIAKVRQSMVIRQSRFNTYDSAKAKHSNTVHFPAPCDPSSTSTSQCNHNKHKPNTTCNPQSYCNPGAIPTSTRNSCTKRPGNIEPGEGHREALSPGSHRTAPATTQRKSYIPTDHVQTDTPAQQTQT